MLQTIEALLDPNGVIHWQEKVKIQRPTKVLITFLSPADEQGDSDIEDLFGVLTASKGVSLEAMDAAIRERGSQHDFD